MPTMDLNIENFLLDSKNPRFAHGSSQREILQEILDDQQEKLFSLAESIVDEGMNPMDRLLVIRSEKDPKKFTTLEGNRRIAALKILSNSTILAGMELKDALRKRFEKLATRFEPSQVEPIAAFEVPDRETGTSWILLRHTGENEGRGVVSWSGLAASRFRGTHPALQALDFVKFKGGLNDEQRALLEDNNYPITTLDRLLSSRDVRKLIGIDVDKSKLVTVLPADEVMKPLRRIVLDLAQKRVNVSKLKDKAQQVQYVEGFGAESKPDLSKTGSKRAIETITDSDFEHSSTSPNPKRRKPDPTERKTIVPKGVRLNILDNKVASIFKELRSLKLNDAPNAIAVLLRVFLELSVDYYMRSNSLPTRNKDPKSGAENEKKLSKKVEETVNHLVGKGQTRRDFNGILRALGDRRSPLSIDLLNDYLHNRFVIPKSHDLSAAWGEAQPFFERIWS